MQKSPPDVDCPLVSYTVVQEVDGEIWVNLEMIGLDGRTTTVRFDTCGVLAAVAELFWEAAVDLHTADSEGIEALIEIKGLLAEDDDELTLADLEAGRVTGFAKHRTDLRFPWCHDD